MKLFLIKIYAIRPRWKRIIFIFIYTYADQKKKNDVPTFGNKCLAASQQSQKLYINFTS